MKITIMNLDKENLSKALSNPKKLLDKKLLEEYKEHKEGKEVLELSIEKCCFSVKSLPSLIDLLAKHPQINAITFNECYFFKDGTNYPHSGLRAEPIALLKYLGQQLVKTNIQHFTLLDESHSVCAEATIAFAEEIQSNTKLKTMTYYTGTRGTLQFCKVVPTMSNLLEFTNPNVNNDKFYSKEDKRLVMHKSYDVLQKTLEERRAHFKKKEAERNAESLALAEIEFDFDNTRAKFNEYDHLLLSAQNNYGTSASSDTESAQESKRTKILNASSKRA